MADPSAAGAQTEAIGYYVGSALQTEEQVFEAFRAEEDAALQRELDGQAAAEREREQQYEVELRQRMKAKVPPPPPPPNRGRA